jgi:hypothetical protein
MNCPQCDSAETRTLEMAYAANTSSGTLTAKSYTFGVGATLTAGQIKQQSGLASRIQLPSPPFLTSWGTTLIVSLMPVILVAIIAGQIATLFDPLLMTPTSGVIIIVPSLMTAILLSPRIFKMMRVKNEKKKEAYAHNIERWRKTWICLRCGHTWIR